ncbi:MAG: 30S ribosomal protein S2 [Myxococcales bacterium]|nr:30S ribosomal protein S2 [Myxococcales bacterium]
MHRGRRIQRRTTMEKITVRQMLEAGAHFGHQTRRWNPKMRPFIYGARNGIHIINLGKTAKLFRDAQSFISRTTARGDQVLFVATKRQARDIVREEAERCEMPVVAYRWLGGTLTNFKTVKTSIEKLNDYEAKLAPGMAERLPKKEVATITKKHAKLVRNLGGLRNMPKMPGAIFVVDPDSEHIAIAEARRLKIPVVALIDTNGNPDEVDYPIPANDDAMRSIRLFVQAMADACLAGVQAGKVAFAQDFDGVTAAADTANVEVVRKPRKRAEEAPAAEAAAPAAAEAAAPAAAEAAAPAAEAPAAAAE